MASHGTTPAAGMRMSGDRRRPLCPAAAAATRRARSRRYSASAETLARIASCSKVPVPPSVSVRIDCTTIAICGVRCSGMHGREALRQEAVAREREQHARHRQRHAAEIAERRNRRAREQQRSRPAAHRHAGGIGERRGGGPREVVAEHALRHHLQRDVEHGDGDHRQRDRARHRARGIAHFAARHQRALDAREREDQQQRRRARRRRPPASRRCEDCPALMKKAPPMATSSSGSSFATVAIEFSRTLSVDAPASSRSTRTRTPRPAPQVDAVPASAGTS